MVLTFITAWILILLGTVLGAGGMWLAALGGSWAYGVAAGGHGSFGTTPGDTVLAYELK